MCDVEEKLFGFLAINHSLGEKIHLEVDVYVDGSTLAGGNRMTLGMHQRLDCDRGEGRGGRRKRAIGAEDRKNALRFPAIATCTNMYKYNRYE